jgi:hypothetical protein
MKNADVDSGIDWGNLVKTRLEGRREPDWLRPEDILFTARGNRNVAVHLAAVPVRAVCAPHFFLIRVDPQRALPEFVAWQMNLPAAQNYFAQEATGSFITNIRKQVLETMSLFIPSHERQQLTIQLYRAAKRERQLIDLLRVNREKELNLLAKKLLGQD